MVKKQFNLILSLDYEIFGNGKGSVRRHIIDPTARILKVCEKYNYKLSIMFEVGEYWSFKLAEQEGKLNHLGYSPSKLMEDQIKQATIQGHDIQLHLHPQWINSAYKDGNWDLDYKFSRLSDFPYESESTLDVSVISLLKKGKTTLESLLKKVNKEYQCIAFRAGSWCIQPELKIIRAMRNVGFKIDSSVFKDGFSTGLSEYDYRSAPFAIGYWWTTENEVCMLGTQGENIIESPIYALNRPFYHNLKFSKFKAIMKSRLQSTKGYATSNGNSGPGIKSYISNPFRSYPFKLDFCKLSFRDMKYFIDNALNTKFPEENTVVPIVAIGHSKNFNNESNFDKFLELLSTQYKNVIQTSTFSSLWNSIETHESN